MTLFDYITIPLLCAIASAMTAAISAIRLPELWRWLDRKPLNCRPCSTFHFTWLLTGTMALVLESWQLFAAGIATAFIAFFITKYIDNKKITK